MASRQKSAAYVEAGRSPWHNRRILLIVVRMLSVSPKQALNSLINSSKLFSSGDSISNNGVNRANAEPLSRVPTSPTRDASVGYQEGCI